MKRLFLSFVSATGLASAATAQAPQQQSTANPNQLNPLLYTGTPVGTPVMRSVGTPVQPVGQQQGTKVGMTQPEWRQDALPPNGQLINLKNSVAPVPTSSLPPALRPKESPSLWDQFYTKWATAIGIKKPEDTTTTGYVPGMTRRAKERRERRWIWD